MKKCNSCNTEFADTLDFCPECGSKDFGTVEEVKEETAQPVAEEEKAPEQAETTEATEVVDEAEAAEEEEPIPVVGLIIAGVIGLIILGVGLYFRLRH